MISGTSRAPMLMRTAQADKDPGDPTVRSGIRRRGSLKRRLLGWFLVVALVPLTVVSAVSYHTAKKSLRNAALKSLAATVQEKAGFIDNWFHCRLIDLESQATSVSNSRFLGELGDAFRAGGKDLGAFVRSYRWTVIVDERDEDLKTFQKLYGYNDVFLLDAEGNILFTVAEQSDLGTNLFDGPLAKTRFAAACRRALATGRPAFSDLEYYAPSNDTVAGFLAELIVDENGEKIGVFAIYLAYEGIENEMRAGVGLEEGFQAYLVGQSPEQDGVTLRTALGAGWPTEDAADNRDSQPSARLDYLSRRVDTEQTRLWMAGRGADGTETDAVGTLENAHVYEGPNGEAVLGVHMDIAFANVTWGIIAEIPEQEAFAQIQNLGILVLVLVVVTAVVVVVIGTILASHIVRPIVRLSGAAELVAQGDLTQRIDSEATDEIGELAACFNWMVSNLSRLFGDLDTRGKELAEQAEKLKTVTETSAESEAYTRAILESAPDAIITIDAGGVVREFNPAAERIFGFESAEIIGRSLTRVMPPSYRLLHEQGLARYLNSGEARILRQTVEVQGLRKDGTTFPLELTVDEIGGSNRQLFTAIARDITARKKMEEEFRQTNARLEEQTARAGNMVANLHEAAIHQEKLEWFQTGQTELTNRMRGGQEIPSLARNIITYVAKYVGVEMGAFYIPDESGCFKLSGSYAFRARKNFINKFGLGEGLVGQAALEKEHILLTNVPDDYIAISSGLGETPPRHVLVWPVLCEQEVKGVIELGALEAIDDRCIEFLSQVSENIGIALNVSQARQVQQELLEESRRTAVELAASEARTRSILESAADGIIVIDERGKIELFNPTAERIFGYSESEMVGENIKMLLPSPEQEEHDGYLAKYLRTGERHVIGSSRELRGIRKDGTIFPLDLSVSESNTGGNRKFTGMVRDITQRKRDEKKLRDTNALLAEQAAKLRVSEESLQQLLQESQAKSEKLESQTTMLQAREVELKHSNRNLAEKTAKLQASEESLMQQSEELQAANEELKEKTESLERQKKDLEQAKRDVEEKAEDVALASKYKSEFLANMSHELRTPLNSLLILSESLASNDEGNLTPEQVESANVIHGGGQELLALINDILDLAKVESGKLEAHLEPTDLRALADAMHSQFMPLAEQKGLTLEINLADDLPEMLVTDGQKVEQILRNLFSNAFKFTQTGSITLQVSRPEAHIRFPHSNLTPDTAIALSVTDTGIGIPQDKQKTIFESFQQADGSTSRKYGGTGLGLTISREFAALLGGEILLQSRQGIGSTFTLCLPLNAAPSAGDLATMPTQPGNLDDVIQAPVDSSEQPFLPDDRAELGPKDRSILIVEDDRRFAQVLMDLCRRKGFKCLAEGAGAAALEVVAKYKPSAVLLDLGLPDMDGMAVLDELKHNLATRHIPVLIVSSRDKDIAALTKGAIGYLRKPVSSDDILQALDGIEKLLQSTVKHLLVIENDVSMHALITNAVKTKGVEVTMATSGEEGYQQLLSGMFDCLILDLGLEGMNGFELLERLKKESVPTPPVIVYTGQELSVNEQRRLEMFGSSVVFKDSASIGILADKVSLFLHSVESALPDSQRRSIQMPHNPAETLRERKILLVDDDMRNTFALTKVLEKTGIKVVLAENGQLALDALAREDDVDLVIMDIMMPIMDGYEAIRRIRREERMADLPIIALTAKAMPEDRAKCLEAGANDYLTKPVDVDRLLSLIRVWIFNK